MGRTRQTAILALAAAVIFTGGVGAEANDFIKTGAADAFSYEDSRFGNQRTDAIDRTSGGWKHFTDFAGFGPLWVWTHDSHNVAYIWNGTTYERFADFDAAVGDTQRITIGCNRGTVTLAAREAVTVPAGTFADCVRLDLQTSCADAGVTRVWFARDIGVVKWSETNFAGVLTWELTSATVDGVTYPSSGGLEVCATFSATEVYFNRMPGTIPNTRPAPSVRATLTVTNNGARDLSFTFRGGQRYEIELLDANGVSIRRWSEGKAFTRDLPTLRLAPGETWRWSDTLTMVHPDGTEVPVGTYTLRISQTTMRGPTVGASAPLNLSEVF